MKLAGYVRVSTDRQAERGLGLDVQEQGIRAWAREHGHRIDAVYTDAGVSGANGIDSRKGLPEALAAIHDGRVGGLVVYRLDRLARDLVVQETLLAEVWRMGGEVFSTAGGEADLRDDANDPSRKLIRQILGAVAAYERSMTSLRLQAGRRAKAAAGGYAYGSPPLGWRSVDGVLEPVEAEQETLARMRELRAQGASLRAIAERLTAEGRPTKRGGRWQPQTVKVALQQAEH
jgi:DNA invertase Pin-like site-specific DNA recombinase